MKKQLPDGAQPVPNSLDALIKARLTGGLDPKTSSATTPSLVATTSVGELRLIDPNDIVVTGDRYRRFVEVDDLINSLRENGQIVPILVRPDLTLVNGLRRLSACKALEVNVLAHVVEVANPDAAQIEEDRCREDLLPSEVYRVTESIRPRLADEAWARKVLGKAADKAIKKGRVDDLLADHVGISRGTLKKIREMYQGFEDSPDTFAEVIEAMERDRRIDKHYKAFKALSVPRYEGPMLNSAAISPDWQEVAKVNAAHLLSAVQKLGLRELIQEPGFVLLPTTIELLPTALTILSKLGAKLESVIKGAADGEEILLFGAFGKFLDEVDQALKAVQGACLKGVSAVEAFRTATDPATNLVISLVEALPRAA